MTCRIPALTADQFVILVNGALAIGATRSHTHPAAVARRVAERLLDDIPRP
ncbi:hypothetical protein [Sphaerisporangium rubeum]|uniref:Uncharacterized protein n=1 Tax=Sphaerisporangium rubeum TaxID=321317 RepID=A0A7X0IFM6_9ACTN|nr:hypothetical protein [Sphaerisporangium rubeum]MBB6474352.1 hypothetical protein [Sphaerisporangium rubeum]